MDSVKVAIRVRPLITREHGSDILWTAETQQIKQKDGKGKPYIFDRVYGSKETTNDVYEEIVEPIVQSAMTGFNGTVFAYGQTSSGKTYTMMGVDSDPGIIPLSTPEREFLLRVSYMEIYNEVVRDLLSPNDGPGLQIREDEFRNTVVQGLTEKLVREKADVIELMKAGDKMRHTGSTNMNERSSRSHTIFRMIIESRERVDPDATTDSVDNDMAITVSQLNLVDLAGSEKAHQTGAEGQRFKEGCFINKSLSTLGLVINQICAASESGSTAPFVSYRDSKLTRILQPSLGGNSLTAIICTVTPVSSDDTDSTLRFASNAKKIKNKPHVNEVLSDEALLYRQKREINQLKKKIHELELNAGKKKAEELEAMLGEKEKLQKEQAERIEMLKKIILVSNQPVDTMKRLRNARRVTWCPGKIKGAGRAGSSWQTPNKARQDDFFQKLDQTLRATEFEPIGKRARFMDDPVTSSISPVPSASKEESDAASAVFVSLEDELIQMQQQRQQLEEDLAEIKSQNTSILKEKETLTFKMMSKDGEIESLRETLDEVLDEKAQVDKEKAELEKSIRNQNEKITEYMRKEKQWENSNPDIRGYRNENAHLLEQLTEAFSQNRRLQEKYDDSQDSIHQLQCNYDGMTQNLKDKEESLEDYKNQVSALQNQLEATLSTSKSHHFVNHDSTRLEEEVKALKRDIELKDSELWEKKREIKDLNEKLEMQDDMEEVFKQLEEQSSENLQLKLQVKKLEKDSEEHATVTDGIDSLKSGIASLQQQLADKDNELIELRAKERKCSDGTMNESVKIGEKTFGDYLSACESLIEERAAMKKQFEELYNENEKLRLEIEEKRPLKFTEQSMCDAIAAYDGVKEQKESIDKEKKELEEEVERLRSELQRDHSLMENQEFMSLEKQVFFEQEKENEAKIESLKTQVTDLHAELEKLRTLQMNKSCEGDVAPKDQDDRSDSHSKSLQEEVCGLRRSCKDAQDMLQMANKDLANANTTEQLEKELKRVNLDLESFGAMEEITKQKYEQKIKDLTNQLRSTFDQLDGDANGLNEPAGLSSEIEEYKTLLGQKDVEIENLSHQISGLEQSKILLDQKEAEIENLNKRITASSEELEEMRSSLEDYKVKLEGSLKLDSEENSVLEDLAAFLQETGLQPQDLKNKIIAVSNLEEENKNLVVEEQRKSSRISDLEDLLKVQQEKCLLTDSLEKKISELEAEIKDKEASLLEIQNSSSQLDAQKYAEMQNLNVEKEEQITKLENQLKRSSSRQEEVERQLNLISTSSSEDEKSLRELLVQARRELAEMTEKYDRLTTKMEQADGALLAETNRDLDQQRLLQIAEREKRESAWAVATERESANKQISQLLAKVNELQTTLSKSNVDKDVALRQLTKTTEECEFLQKQVKDLETMHKNETCIIPRGQATDPYKLMSKIKQLSLNLEWTKQTSEKLTTANKALKDENRRLESEIAKVISLQAEISKLQAILDQERKTWQENAVRQNSVQKESDEMRQKIIELQKNLREMETKLEEKLTESSESIRKSAADNKILQDEIQNLEFRNNTLNVTIQDLRDNAKNAEVRENELVESMQKIKTEMEEVLIRKNASEQEAETLQDRLNHALHVLEEEKKNSDNLSQNNNILISQLDEIKEESESKQQMLDDYKEKGTLMAQTLEQMKQKLQSMKSEEENIRLEILNSEKLKQEDLERRLSDADEMMRKVVDERDSLSVKISVLEKSSEQQEDLEKQTSFKVLQDQYEKLNLEKDSLQARVQELEVATALKDGELSDPPESSKTDESVEKIDCLEAELEEMVLAKETAEKSLEDAKEEYQNIIDEMKVMIATKDDKIKELTENANSASPMEDSSSEEVNRLRDELDKKEEEIEMLRKQSEDFENKCVALQEEIHKHSDSLSKQDPIGLEFSASLDQEVIDKLYDEVAELKLQLAEKDELIEELKMSGPSVPLVNSAQQDDEAARIQMSSQLESANEEVKILQKKKTDQEAEIASLRSMVSTEQVGMVEVRKQLQDLQVSLKKEDARAASLKARKEEVENELLKLKEENQILIQKLEEKFSLDEEKQDVEEKSELAQKCHDLENSISDLEKKIEDLTSKLCKAEEQRESVSSLCVEKDNKITMMETEIGIISNEKVALVEKYEEVGRNVSSLEETVTALENQLIEDSENHRTELERLQKEKDDDLAKLEENCMAQESQKIEKLLGENRELTEKCQNLQGNVASLELEIHQLNDASNNLKMVGGCDNVQNEGSNSPESTSAVDMAESKPTISEDDEDSRTEKIAKLESELDHYKAQASDLQTQLDSVFAVIQEKAAVMEEAASSREALELEVKTLEEEKLDLETKLEQTEIKLESAEKHIQELLDNVSELEKDNGLLSLEKEKCVKANSSLEEAVNKIDYLQKQLVSVKDEKSILVEQEKATIIEEAASARKVLEVEIKTLEEEKMGLQTKLEQAHMKHESAEKRIQELLDNISELEKDISSLSLENNEQCSKADSSLKDALTKIDNLEKEMKMFEDERSILVEQLSDSKQNIQLMQDKMEEIANQREALESKIGELEERHKKELESERNTAADKSKENLEKIKGLLYKKELEVQSLESEISKWVRRHENDKDDLETAVKAAKDEISALNKENSEKIMELQEKVLELQEKASSDAQVIQKLTEAEEKAETAQSKLYKRINDMEDGMIEQHKEFEEEKEKCDAAEAKVRELEAKLKAQSSDKHASNFQEKYKEEKKKSLSLDALLRAEKKRCSELSDKLEAQNKNNKSDNDGLAKELYMARGTIKDLSEKYSKCEEEFQSKINEKQERMDAMREKMAKRISELEDSCMEVDTELEDEKKKTSSLEEKIENLKKEYKTEECSNLEKKLQTKEGEIGRLQIQLKSCKEPLEREVSQLKEEIEVSENRITQLKQQMKLLQSNGDGGNQTSGRVTRSKNRQTLHAPGGLVEDTKVFVLEMEIRDNQHKIKYLEKELAKYKDIETRRRSENMELLEENNKYRSIIKKAREKKGISSDVLTENTAIVNQATLATASGGLRNSAQDDKCKNQ